MVSIHYVASILMGFIPFTSQRSTKIIYIIMTGIDSDKQKKKCLHTLGKQRVKIETGVPGGGSSPRYADRVFMIDILNLTMPIGMIFIVIDSFHKCLSFNSVKF